MIRINLKEKADNIRERIIRIGYQTQQGHIGSSLSCVEILTALYFSVLKRDDKFILSSGHKSLALYSTLCELGRLKEEDIPKLSGHPAKNSDLGIEVSTGSLGHGLSIGCGFTLAGFQTYVLCSDGDFDEGSTWEAMKFAKEHDLRKLTCILDANGWSAYDYRPKFLYKDFFNCGWSIRQVDGHSLKELTTSMEAGFGWDTKSSKPRLIIATTTKGKGLKGFEDRLDSHYLPITKEVYENYSH